MNLLLNSVLFITTSTESLIVYSLIVQTLLQEKHVIKSQAEPFSAVTGQLSATLHSIVEEVLDEAEAKDVLSRSSLSRSFLEEINQHLTFCQREASCSVNRESALMVVKRYRK